MQKNIALFFLLHPQAISQQNILEGVTHHNLKFTGLYSPLHFLVQQFQITGLPVAFNRIRYSRCLPGKSNAERERLSPTSRWDSPITATIISLSCANRTPSSIIASSSAVKG